jgi:hypothetical protein
MMFLNSLTNWLRKQQNSAEKSPQRPHTRLRLEELEDRLVPTPITGIGTYTNASVQITPGFTVTEKVTATVTNFPTVSVNSSTGAVTVNPIPNGAPSPSGGTVLFNLNNMQQLATLNSSGQATATFQVPLLAFLTSQELTVSYSPFVQFTDSSGNSWNGSTFNAPLYKNWDNVLLPATLTFNQLTPQQVNAEFISYEQNNVGSPTPPNNPSTLDPYYTAQGEKDDFGLFSYSYVDPGTIQTVTALGMQLPGIFAANLGAYNGLNIKIGIGSS